MDRMHPWLKPNEVSSCKKDGTGHFYKEHINKPPLFEHIPRHYSRYGLPLNTVVRRIKEIPRPDLICVTSGMTYWYPGAAEIISLLKDHFKTVPVVLGGIYATLCREHALRFSGADRVISGPDIAEIVRLAGEITGHKNKNGEYKALRDLPSPAYHLYDRLRSAAILTSWGCPYNCPFCASSLLYNSLETRLIDQSVQDIKYLVKRGVRHIAFYDDALLYRKELHIKPLLKTLKNLKLPVKFHTPNGIQLCDIDEELAFLLMDSGFETIRLSFESSNSDRQKSMGGKVNCDDFCRAAAYLEKAGYMRNSLASYLLAGLPGQALGEVIESVRFVYAQGVKVSLAAFSPIPGTKCWAEAESLGLVSEADDPLISNNTAFSILSGQHSFKALTRLGSLVANGNQLLHRNRNPMTEPAFLKTLEALEDMA